MITFEYVTLEGFGAIVKKLKYNLNQPGLNVLQATNGQGKTTIFSGLTWTLYGKSLKPKSDPVTWSDKRGKDFKGTKGKVVVRINDNKYTIIRYEKYKINGKKAESKLEFYINGVESGTKGKVAIQAEITKVLGFSLELFKNSAIFGQKMKRIIEEDGPTKKKVFDEAFDIGYIQMAKEVTEAKRKLVVQELDKVDDKLDNTKSFLLMAEENYAKMKTLIDNADKDKRQKIEAVEKDIKKQKKLIKVWKADMVKLNPKEVSVFKEKMDELEAITNEVNEISNKKFKKEFEIENVKGDIENETAHQIKLKDKYTSVIKKCPRCGQKLSKALIASELSGIKADIARSKSLQIASRVKLEKCQEELKGFNKFLDKYKTLKDEYNKLNNEIKLEQTKGTAKATLKQSIFNSNQLIAIFKKRIQDIYDEKLEINLEEIQTKIDNYKKELEPLKELQIHYKKQLELNNWLIKDPLSNSGIKAFIFDEMLDLINDRLANYSQELGFQITFGIDLETAAKDFYIAISDKGNIRLYEDLSGGEQQLVNICIAFAVHDVICLEKDINILICDEVFEGLASENIEIVSNLISRKAQGKSIHIITHHQNFNPTNAHFIRVKKKKTGTVLL